MPDEISAEQRDQIESRVREALERDYVFITKKLWWRTIGVLGGVLVVVVFSGWRLHDSVEISAKVRAEQVAREEAQRAFGIDRIGEMQDQIYSSMDSVKRDSEAVRAIRSAAEAGYGERLREIDRAVFVIDKERADDRRVLSKLAREARRMGAVLSEHIKATVDTVPANVSDDLKTLDMELDILHMQMGTIVADEWYEHLYDLKHDADD